MDQTEEPRQNGSNNFSHVLVCNFSSNELNHLNPTCMMCATDLSERSHMENLPVTLVRNFGCTPWQDMKSAKFLEVLPVARSTLTKARTMFAIESRSCHDQVLNQTFLYEMIYGGPIVGHQGSKFGHQWAPQTIFISALGAAVFFDCDANEQLSCQFCGNWIRVHLFVSLIGLDTCSSCHLSKVKTPTDQLFQDRNLLFWHFRS